MKKLFQKECVALVFSLFFGMSAFSAEVVTIGGLKYELNGIEAYVSGYEGEPTDVVIPVTIESEGQTFRVTQVNPSAFKQCSSITSLISTGGNLKTISANAFSVCPNLKQVKLVCAEGGSISHYAFNDCESLEEVNLNCSTIGFRTFYNCINLQRVTLMSVKSMGSYYGEDTWINTNYASRIGGETFSNCSSLTYIDLGDKLESVSTNLFQGCTKLTYVVIPITCIYCYCFKVGSNNWSYCWTKDSFDSQSNIFSGCTRLQSIIYLGNQTSQCGSNATVYHAKDMVHWSSTEFDYQGKAPTVTFTCDMPAGFTPSAYDVTAMEVNTGTYTQNVPFTFTNNDMSFNVDIPYTYTIKPVTLTAKVKDDSRAYGDGNPQFNSTYTGFVNNEDASVVTNHGTYTTTATEKSDVGTYPITQSGATAQNYTFNYEDGTLTVNKASLTMTANDKTMTYGSKVPTLDVTYEGLKNNESVPTWTTEPTITTTATPTSKAGQYPIVISNAEAKNYNLTLQDGTLTVEKAPLTAKVDNKSRLYGDANPEFTLTYTGLKNNETAPEWEFQPLFETVATTQSNVGCYDVTLKDAVATNYDITPIDGTLTVNKAPLTITPKNATRTYGAQDPQFELLYEGLKNNENQPEWTEVPVFTTNATQGSSVGEYTINVKSAEARNYTLEKGNGKLTITKAPLTIQVKNVTRQYGMDNPNFEMEYAGLVNDETAPAWLTYPIISTTASNKSDVGEYPIKAEGGELKNYESDGIVPGVLTITSASLLIKAKDISRAYYEENPTLTFDCVGFVEGDSPAMFINPPVITTTATQQSPAGLYPIKVSGAEIDNYQLSYENGQLTVNKRMLTVSTGNYTREYGEENPEFVLRYKGFVNNENESVLIAKPKATTEADQYTDTGVYDITVANGVAENYDFVYVGGTLTIEKAYQTLTWDQVLTGINLYDQVELMATASSGLEVQYTLQPNNICSLVKIGRKQYLDCYGVGETVLIASQEGNNNYWQTTRMYKVVRIGVPTDIDQLTIETDGTEQIFDAKGCRINSLQPGINIIKTSDGRTRKVFVK